MKTINILGLNITAISKSELLDTIASFIADGKQHRIITPNPEILLAAVKDEEYFHVINTADLSLPDGIGLKFAAWSMGKTLPRHTGVDLARELLGFAEKQNLKVAVFNRRDGLSSNEDIARYLSSTFPALKFQVITADKEWIMPYYESANLFEPDLIFTALGAPWQDKFNHSVLERMPYVKLAVGIGGAFDFMTGKVKRAPRFMRRLGFEWLWRLIKLPSYSYRLARVRRISDAVIVFPLVFLRWRFISPHFYRPNVAVLLYKRTDKDYAILAVERRGEPGHWQLPQGGTDGADITTAGLREISEETNSTKVRPVKAFKNLHRYKFPKNKIDRHQNRTPQRHSGYKGQKQSLLIAEYLGRDEDIKLKYWDHSAWKWISSEKLSESLHPTRRPPAEIYLRKFQETVTDAK